MSRLLRLVRLLPATLVAAFVASLLTGCASTGPSRDEIARWQTSAAAVTITRDDWGIPHIKGATDADAVFGMIYAQAEDDFNRIEVNYLNSMGRLAEAEGEHAIWSDLRQRLFIDADSIRSQFAASPAWLQTLMTAWADGLNFYLYTHPAVKSRVLTRFEPWMALTFSEGSIGGDISGVSLTQLEAFYGKPASAPRPPAAPAASPDGAPSGPPAPRKPRSSPLKRISATAAAAQVPFREPGGSNGFAIAPTRTAGGKALLLINPHTSFFFREELQMTSDEGLNAYGAVTWGQFFIYQGFNARAGWMHTTSGADVVDEYAETIVPTAEGFAYRYNSEDRPLGTRRITIAVRSPDGMMSREFTVYRSHHGPVVREADGKWISVKMMQEPVKALIQSYTRTKAANYAAFKETMQLHTNSSNNTVFADAEGNVAFFLANFVPRRDGRFDWTRPVDGSDPVTEWQGIHEVDESPNVLNPTTGWIQNTNNWPYSVSGASSPDAKAFARYFDTSGENARGVHAVEVLSRKRDFTLATLIDAAYDPHLTAFDDLVMAIQRDYVKLPASDPRRLSLAEQIATLRAWDGRSNVESVATSLAVYWGEDLWQRVRADPEAEGDVSQYTYLAKGATSEQRLASLEAATKRLTDDFGTWKTPWGEINRFQRLTGDIVQPFNDAKPSTPVGFTSSRWGSLASFGARPYLGTKRIYGTSGNSFVAVVEFGDSVRARAVTAGGLNSEPSNKHFNDQADRYAAGDLREVYFYPGQLAAHTERTYHPGK